MKGNNGNYVCYDVAVKFFREKALKFHIVFFVAVISSVILARSAVRADELAEIEKQIADLKNQMQMSVNATIPLEEEVDKLSTQIKSIQAQIVAGGVKIEELERDIEIRERQVENQYLLLSSRVRDYYKKSRFYSPFLVFVSSQTAHDLTRGLVYKEITADEDKNYIVALTKDLLSLEDDKRKVEEDRARLAVLQADLDEQRDFFEGEIAGAKAYQNQLQGQIAELTARQQEIINARSGSFTVSGDSELADDYLASIKGFNESAPPGYFAVFSFGGYSHRNGMSQYGALGRAIQGQNAQQILAAYYPGTSINSSYSAMDQITVSGYGSGSFEDWYLKRIYEVPGSWPMEVLKAQAIAARTYAIKYTNNGQSSICATESCQVFKDVPKGGAWEEAVNQTRGMVLVDGGGNPTSTQYASTHGGWSKTSGWDTTDGSGGSTLLEKAYEKIGGSPWLYKSWWRAGYTSSGSTCGRSNPWLSPEEMADIVNAHLVLKNGSGSETERISPVTTDCWGGNPYSVGELRDVAGKYGGISSAGSVSVSLGEGRTNSVNVGGVSINGDDFCRAYNLRAPGNLRIPQWSGSSCSGAFFNIERK